MSTQFDSEAAFEMYLAGHFERHGCIVHRQPWCNVHNDTGSSDGGRRRADLHVQLPEPLEGWLSCFVVELKLDGSTGDIRAGAKQAIAYMGAFDWRVGPGRHDERRLPRPDISLFTTPGILSRGCRDGSDFIYLERDLWDNGAALMVAHRGPMPGTQFKLIEKTRLLTGRWRT